MIKYIFSIGVWLLCLSSLRGQIAFESDFESYADEKLFDRADWQAEGYTVPWVDGFDQSRAYIDNAEAYSGSNALRISFPAAGFGPSASGAQAPLLLTGRSEWYSSYYVKFNSAFSWGTTSEGGKLPGLAGGARCSGCATCNGSNGFSCRLMWRENGKAVLYLYHMDKSGSCGDNLELKKPDNSTFYFQKDTWYKISQYVKVNSGSAYDGEVRLWINDQEALTVSGLRFVTNGDQVDAFYFSTFHGGSTSAWAPTVNSFAWFDDLVISTQESDVVNIPLSLQAGSSAQVPDQTNIMVLPSHAERGANIILPEGITDCTLRWYDLTGVALLSKESQAPSQCPAGFYIIEYLHAGGIERRLIYLK
jgi:hypothetical protein